MIDELTAIVAAVVSVISLVLCFWLPKKHTMMTSVGVYLMGVAIISTLIFTSGGTDSPFISSWLIVAIFASFFGSGVVAGMAVLVIAQLALTHLQQPLDLPAIITQLIFGIAPLMLSFVLWHRQPDKKVDSSLKELTSRLSTVEGKSDVVINTIDDGVMAINREGVIDLINPSAQTLVGWNKGDALGLDWRSVLKLIAPDGREVSGVENPIAKALATNKPTHSDKLSLMTGSDRKRLVSVTSSPVGQGENGIIVIFRDITKEKAEEREQAEFISTASHEMRTPVASIEGYLGLALNPVTAQIDDKARDFITKAHQSAQHLGQLFQNLLDISQSEDGRLKNEPKIIDVTAMVRDIFESLATLAQQKQLRYFFKPNPSLDDDNTRRKLEPVFYAHVDPSHLREIVSNYIENAIKYTPQGEVIVDITGDEDMVTISVQDTGLGIPSEDIPHLFQKFYRVDNSDSREIGGTGLGLYLCRRLAETMGGHVRVESEYKKGSTFFLDVPRISHEEAIQKLNSLPDELPDIQLQQNTPLAQATPAQEQTPAPTYSGLESWSSPQVAQPTQPSAPTLAEIEASVAQQSPQAPAGAMITPAQTPPVDTPTASPPPPITPQHQAQPTQAPTQSHLPRYPARQQSVEIPPRPPS